MLGLLRGGRGSSCAQLFAGRLTSPGSGIDLANDVQPLFGFGECGEVAHVKPETLAAFLEAPADKEGKALQLRQIHLGQRHRRGRRAEIQYKRARLGFRRRRRLPCFRATGRARSHIWRW
jgi:hypothetical protein